MLIVVFLISLRLASSVLRSIHELSAGFERFGRGDFSPMTVRRDDELAYAAREANRMARNLEALTEQQRRSQEELARANKDLEAFSYSVAHDLRAPLRSIDGFSLALVEDFGDKLEPEARGYLERVRAAAQRMAQLIDDLLLLSRITRAELRRQRVDLADLARAIAAELQAREPGRRVMFQVAQALEVEADPQLMRVVMENLLGNAWKFTSKRERATIEVGVGGEEGARHFFVRDDGAGFDMAHVERLFRPFQRLHSAAEYPGTGIGLASVQRIVSRHGGRIWATGAPNAGATFSFTLGG
ncbi:MAG: hypothetical protein HY901_04935 [Deltaproteobacteria bacterium]|nr:hypothetical protein [Deltaproteobacteria bacterium]